MLEEPSDASQIQKPGHVSRDVVAEIQKPGHITRAYSAAVQAQLQAAHSHEEILLALQEQAGISRPGYDPLRGEQPGEGIIRPGHVASEPSPEQGISRPLGKETLQEALREVAAASQALARASNTLRQLITRPGF